MHDARGQIHEIPFVHQVDVELRNPDVDEQDAESGGRDHGALGTEGFCRDLHSFAIALRGRHCRSRSQ